MLLTGTYEFAGEISRRLLGAPPHMLVVAANSADEVLPDLLDTEVVEHDPGQQAVLDRLLDLLLISTLRTWFSRADSATRREPTTEPRHCRSSHIVSARRFLDGLAADRGLPVWPRAT